MRLSALVLQALNALGLIPFTIYAESGERWRNADKQDRRPQTPRQVSPIEGVAGLLFSLRKKYRGIDTMSMNHTAKVYLPTSSA